MTAKRILINDLKMSSSQLSNHRFLENCQFISKSLFHVHLDAFPNLKFQSLKMPVNVYATGMNINLALIRYHHVWYI